MAKVTINVKSLPERHPMSEPWLEWFLVEMAPETAWGKTIDVLLYGPNIGVRSGSLGNNGGNKYANIASLHGNAIDIWGVTHWARIPDNLPEPPK